MGKGLLAGLIIGFVSRKWNSLTIGLVAGTVIAALFALPIALMNKNAATGEPYFWEIMIPGSMVGLIVGYATQKFGTPRRA
jgi:uncharacterized membrane protein (Fun14 family)